jgi:ubiquinone/menaquinone biosynthesis C-methylase UbiE
MLYDFIFSHVREFETAWDCGTGNGQVARDLAVKFKKVYATDISAQQLDNAHSAPNIFYSQCGEVTPFSDRQVDLVTVAQAIHWFDRVPFYKEVARVAKRGAPLAVWGYGLMRVNPEIDSLLKHFYTQTVGPYWDPERKLVDDHYQTLDFPFEEIKAPDFHFSMEWSLAEFQGYVTTWSSVQKFMKDRKFNPVEELIVKIRPLWGNQCRVTFPLFLRFGRVS